MVTTLPSRLSCDAASIERTQSAPMVHANQLCEHLNPAAMENWMTNISKLEIAANAARQKLENACRERWPVGTEISFWYSRKAQNCTIGTVVNHCGGRLTVRLQKADRYGRQHVKGVEWNSIS